MGVVVPVGVDSGAVVVGVGVVVGGVGAVVDVDGSSVVGVVRGPVVTVVWSSGSVGAVVGVAVVVSLVGRSTTSPRTSVGNNVLVVVLGFPGRLVVVPEALIVRVEKSTTAGESSSSA